MKGLARRPRGFTKKPAEVLERERAQRRAEAVAKGEAIVAQSNAALQARLAQMREQRLRERARREERRAQVLVARVQHHWAQTGRARA